MLNNIVMEGYCQLLHWQQLSAGGRPDVLFLTPHIAKYNEAGTPGLWAKHLLNVSIGILPHISQSHVY